MIPVRVLDKLNRDQYDVYTDLEAAASFCMAHAMDGMRPMAPKSLKQAWNHLIERTVHEHARA